MYSDIKKKSFILRYPPDFQKDIDELKEFFGCYHSQNRVILDCTNFMLRLIKKYKAQKSKPENYVIKSKLQKLSDDIEVFQRFGY